MLVGGCVGYSSSKVIRGKPIDEAAVGRIEIGKTTRSELFRDLGPPHSIFKGQVELHDTDAMLLLGSMPLHLFPYHEYYSHSENRYLSSVDDLHYAMLYKFSELSGRNTRASIFVVTVSDTELKIATDELLLLIDSKTHVVDDVAYRNATAGS